MTDLDDLPDEHTIQLPFAILTFWEGNLASTSTAFDRVELKLPGSSVSLSSFTSKQWYDCCQLVRALERAFALGQQAKAAEVRRVLGCEPR